MYCGCFQCVITFRMEIMQDGQVQEQREPLNLKVLRNTSEEEETEEGEKKGSLWRPWDEFAPARSGWHCRHCQACVSSLAALRKHIVSVHGAEKPFTCDQCHRGFLWKLHLEKHKKVHDREKKLICDFCRRPFSTQSLLQAHRRAHTGERPFLCELCGKRFTQRHNVIEHLKTHQEERPFSCKLCGRAFRNEKELQSHRPAHTGELVCGFCGYNFTLKSSLRNHLKRVHFIYQAPARSTFNSVSHKQRA